LAVTVAFPVRVNVQVLLPPLVQAPDQTALRPLETVSVIAVPVVNGAGMVLPTATLIPAGLEVTRSPLRPVAVTVSVAVWPGGITVNVAVRVTAPALAVIVTGVDVVTELVAIAKVALVAPCATVTLAGTAAAGSVLDSVAVNPPEGAAPVSVTVPCDAAPPVTLAGLTATDDNEAGGGGSVTVSTALRLAPPNAPLIVAEVDAATGTVLTVKVAFVAPAATVMLAGAVAAVVLLLVRVTIAPPDGAALDSVTVPCELLPPTTVAGLTVSDDNAAGDGVFDIVNTALRLTPPDTPLMVAEVDAVSDAVLTVKVALVAPAATVTLAGTVARAVLLLVNVTTAPPEGAALASVAVPCELLPPTTVDGLSTIAESVAGGGAAGVTVKVADCVTPPPDTEMVTTVWVVTAVVKMLNPPLVVPAGIVTLLIVVATDGLSTVS
jgi:large repetitive protein